MFCCVLLRMDNVSAVRYINSLGVTRWKPLADLVRNFWHFSLDRHISLQAEYLAGLSNAVADWNLRHLKDYSDWRLDHRVFHLLNQALGPISVDLFASRLNTQVPCFFSWRPDLDVLALDALLQDWSNLLGFAFGPFSLIARVIGQTRRQRAQLVLVTPWWPSQPWFPAPMELSLEIP